MVQSLLHTPEGTRDIYNHEYEKKELLQEKMLHLLKCYGYHAIQTPTFEFFDIFGKQIGTTPSRDLYKFFDKEGNTLVLRPDMTPSIARCAAKYYMEEEMPIRLCYVGNTFVNNSRYQGRLKETTQMGAELIGDGSNDGDGEILALSIDTLLQAGLMNFHFGIGHAQFFKGLVKAAALEEETIDELKDFMINKNAFGVEELVDSLALEENLKALFGLITSFHGGIDQIGEAKAYSKNYPEIYASLEALERIFKVLECYDFTKYVSFDFSLMTNHSYYTGLIFAGYTFGSGEPVVRGGRYDHLLQNFGKPAPSVGFTMCIDQLMSALSRQNIDIAVEDKNQLIVYDEGKRYEAVRTAKNLRTGGNHVELLKFDHQKSKKDYEEYAARNHIVKITFMEEED